MSHPYEAYVPSGLSVYAYLKKEAERYGESTAIRFFGKEISYRSMFERIDALANALRAQGVGRDDVVLFQGRWRSCGEKDSPKTV